MTANESFNSIRCCFRGSTSPALLAIAWAFNASALAQVDPSVITEAKDLKKAVLDIDKAVDGKRTYPKEFFDQLGCFYTSGSSDCAIIRDDPNVLRFTREFTLALIGELVAPARGPVIQPANPKSRRPEHELDPASMNELRAMLEKLLPTALTDLAVEQRRRLLNLSAEIFERSNESAIAKLLDLAFPRNAESGEASSTPDEEDERDLIIATIEKIYNRPLLAISPKKQ